MLEEAKVLAEYLVANYSQCQNKRHGYHRFDKGTWEEMTCPSPAKKAELQQTIESEILAKFEADPNKFVKLDEFGIGRIVNSALRKSGLAECFFNPPNLMGMRIKPGEVSVWLKRTGELRSLHHRIFPHNWIGHEEPWWPELHAQCLSWFPSDSPSERYRHEACGDMGALLSPFLRSASSPVYNLRKQNKRRR